MTQATFTQKVTMASAPLARAITSVFVLPFLVVTFLSDVRAQAIDPSDLWFRAYMLIKEGEVLEQTDTLGALNKYVEAKRMLDGLASDNPEFHTDLVRFRRQELSEKIPAYRQLLEQGLTTGVPKTVATPGGTVGHRPPTQSSGEFSSPQNDLPVWDDQSGAIPQQQPRMPNVVAQPPGSVRQTTPEFSQPPVTQPSSQSVIDPLTMLQQKYREQDQKIADLTQLNISLQKQIADREQRFQTMKQEVEQARQKMSLLEKQKQEADALAAKSQDARAEAQRIGQLYENAMKEWKKSLDLNSRLADEKKAMEREIEDLLAEKASVERERDQLQAIVDSSGDSAKAQIAKLTRDNESLRRKLDETRALAEKLSNENANRSEELAERDLIIVQLKKRVGEIEEERMRLISENESYEASIDELKAQLQGLAQNTISPEAIEVAAASPRIGEENELLRSVVLRQIRRQNQIKQSRELLIEELNRIGPESQNLLAMVEDMFRESGLTPAEKELFRDDTEAMAALESTPTESESIAIVVDAEGVLERQNIEQELDQIKKVAELAFNKGDYSESESNYRKFLAYRPRNVACITNLALIKLKTQQYDEAVPLLEKAISIRSDYSHAYYYLGRVLYKQGKLDEALVRLRETIQYEPTHSRAFNCVGVISSEKGLVNKAEDAFIEAVTIDPQYADAHFNLAVLYATKDVPNAEKAGNHYQKAINLGSPRDGAIEQFLATGAMNVYVEPLPGVAPMTATAAPTVISSIR